MAFELDQRFGLFKRFHFALEDTRIRVSIRTIQVKRVYFVDIEKILEVPSEETSGSRLSLWAAVFFGVLTLVTVALRLTGGDVDREAPLVWGIPFVLTAGYYWLSRMTVYAFTADDYPLIFVRNKPSIGAVDAFVARAQAVARQRVRQTTLEDVTDPDDLLARLKWLRDKQIIGEKDYSLMRSRAVAERTRARQTKLELADADPLRDELDDDLDSDA